MIKSVANYKLLRIYAIPLGKRWKNLANRLNLNELCLSGHLVGKSSVYIGRGIKSMALVGKEK